jgi:hypothetical protein
MIFILFYAYNDKKAIFILVMFLQQKYVAKTKELITLSKKILKPQQMFQKLKRWILIKIKFMKITVS